MMPQQISYDNVTPTKTPNNEAFLVAINWALGLLQSSRFATIPIQHFYRLALLMLFFLVLFISPMSKMVQDLKHVNFKLSCHRLCFTIFVFCAQHIGPLYRLALS